MFDYFSLLSPVLPRSNTMPGGIDNNENGTKTSNPANFERSKTERRKANTSPREKNATQLFDDKISTKKKVRPTMLISMGESCYDTGVVM